MPKDRMTVVELYLRRQTAGLTQVEAARLLGVEPDTYGRYERGERRIPRTIDLLARQVLPEVPGRIPRSLPRRPRGRPAGS